MTEHLQKFVVGIGIAAGVLLAILG